MKLKINTITIPPSGKTHSGTVIFLHGSDTGHNLIGWVRYLLGRDMQFEHIKIIYPTAPVQTYTLLSGQASNIWFDVKVSNIDGNEDRKSFAAIYEPIKNLIQSEVDLGIPLNRIIVGGFSMGGTLSMHIGFHLFQHLCGVFVCSAILMTDSIVYDSIKNNPNDKYPEILSFHGDRDNIVLHEWGQTTFNELQKYGIKGKFITIKNTDHELKKMELLILKEWILNKLPPIGCDVINKL